LPPRGALDGSFTAANVSGDIPSDRGLWVFGIVALKLGTMRGQSGHPRRDASRERFDAPRLIS